jgi:Uncharacterized conserved protein (DUF2190)
MSNLNINQETIVPVLGLIDLQLPQGTVLDCQVSPNQSGAIVAGQFVALDTTVTPVVGGLPQIIAATQSVEALGFIPFNTKIDTFNPGDVLEISIGGVVWLQATAVAITPGTIVESDSTGLLVQAYSSHSKRGMALDYAAASAMLRVQTKILAGGTY